jgi:hypothetical protein
MKSLQINLYFTHNKNKNRKNKALTKAPGLTAKLYEFSQPWNNTIGSGSLWPTGQELTALL